MPRIGWDFRKVPVPSGNYNYNTSLFRLWWNECMANLDVTTDIDEDDDEGNHIQEDCQNHTQTMNLQLRITASHVSHSTEIIYVPGTTFPGQQFSYQATLFSCTEQWKSPQKQPESTQLPSVHLHKRGNNEQISFIIIIKESNTPCAFLRVFAGPEPSIPLRDSAMLTVLLEIDAVLPLWCPMLSPKN